jgi:hypothetical protein
MAGLPARLAAGLCPQRPRHILGAARTQRRRQLQTGSSAARMAMVIFSDSYLISSRGEGMHP